MMLCEKCIEELDSCKKGAGASYVLCDKCSMTNAMQYLERKEAKAPINREDKKEWINVKDKLPPSDYSIKILAYGIPTCGTCQKIPGIHFCTYTEKRLFEFGEYDCSLDAFFWMDLPEFPLEEKRTPITKNSNGGPTSQKENYR